jgi:hypothetical protein
MTMNSISNHGGDVNPVARIRELAELERDDAKRDRLYQLAADLEAKFGQQNNTVQVALGLTDLDLRDAFAEEISFLRTDLSKRMDTLDERQQTMLEFLEELQAQLRGLQAS